MIGLLAIALAAVLSGSLTMIARNIALQRSILDEPNHRSSHTTPTPRGGGISIVLVGTLSICLLGATDFLGAHTVVVLCLSSGVVALLGVWDDVRGLSAIGRLGVQLCAAALVIVGLRSQANLVGNGFANIVVMLIEIFALVWLTNLYNFMDGIDGIAGVQALVTGLAISLLNAGSSVGISLLAISIAGAAFGFLLFNWPPAKIFMGDVGSGYLGFMFGALIILSHRDSQIAIAIVSIPLIPFILDTTVTLVRRMVQGKKIMSAHREHLYQRFVQYGYSHKAITTVFGISSSLLAAFAVWSWRTNFSPYCALGIALFVSTSIYLVCEIRLHRSPGRRGLETLRRP